MPPFGNAGPGTVMGSSGRSGKPDGAGIGHRGGAANGGKSAITIVPG